MFQAKWLSKSSADLQENVITTSSMLIMDHTQDLQQTKV